MASNSLSSRSVALLPVLIMIFIHVFVTPLREIFSIEPLFLVPWYGFGILIGIIIYRKTFVVKDYEYRRSNVMKKMKKVYEAEESGVWQTNAAIESDFSEIGKVKLQQKIGDINTESPEMEISNDQKVEVQFLNEASHIVEATKRVTGESNFEETDDITFPPSELIERAISFLDLLNVPVIQKVNPLRFPVVFFSFSSKISKCSDKSNIISLL